MKANELRIGDLVFDNLGGILKIKGVNTDSDLSHIKPIPLTEGICSKIKIGKEDVSLSKVIGVDLFYFVIGDYYKEVYFLHEVQNLYWCLFGEELEVKL